MARLQLTRLALGNFADNQAFVGDPCENREDGPCDGVLGVYTVKKNYEAQRIIRYPSCNKCGWKPEHNKLPSDMPGRRRLPDSD